MLAAVRAGRNPDDAIDPDPWVETLGRLWVSVGEVVYPQHLAELGGDPEKASFSTQLVALVQEIVRRGRPATRVRRFVEDFAEGIVTTSRRRVHTVLREATTPSEIRQVVRTLATLYETEWAGDRAARIALDQTLRAAQVFEHAAVEQVAVSTNRQYVKTWRTQGDDRVRSSHGDASGQTVPYDEPFTVGGVELRHPRDPAGPARETAGCRCWAEHRRV